MELHVSVQVLTILVGTIVPLLVGVVTKKVASRGLKLATNACLSAFAGVISTAIGAGGVIHLEALVSVVETFIVSLAIYHGLWKQIGVSDTIQRATANFGIGGNAIDVDNWTNETAQPASATSDQATFSHQTLLMAKTRSELEPLAKARGITGISRLRKDQLVQAILDWEDSW